MLPFCGYNMADYFGHWLEMGRTVPKPPPIFHVNWFRTDSDGRFLWPGFAQNLRALIWMVERLEGRGQGTETAIGVVPSPDALNLDGLDLPRSTLDGLLRVDREEWAHEVPAIRAFFDTFGDRLPASLARSLEKLAHRLSS
jgi:phosphoenolpyruvate carboxykinase (GTP)